MTAMKSDYQTHSDTRRSGPDRRKKPTNPFSLKAVHGRRKTIRRDEDRWKSPYVDQYSTRFMLACIFLLLLTICDGFYTVFLVSQGARELNPFMKFLLQKGYYVFFFVKYLISALLILALAVFRHVPYFKGVIVFLIISYTALLLYHLYIFFS